jgi:hypothetical protein
MTLTLTFFEVTNRVGATGDTGNYRFLGLGLRSWRAAVFNFLK